MLQAINLQVVGLELNALPIDQKAKLLSELVQDKEILWQLPKNKLKQISKAISKVRKLKYARRRQPKYGLFGAKTMDLPEIDAFFSAFKPEEWRYKVLFLTQAFLGLRIGEVVKIKLEDIDFVNKQIRIHTEKQVHYETDVFMAMHEKLETLLLDYTTIYEKEIKEHDNYIFFSVQRNCHTKHVTTAHARNVFRRICKRAGLDQIYGYREIISEPAALKLYEFLKGEKPQPIKEIKKNLGFSESKIQKILHDYNHFFKLKNGKVRIVEHKLYLYTTHSLRHAFGKYLAKRGVPIEIAKHLLRHQDIKSTQIYYVPDKEQVDATMHNLFAFPETKRKKY